MKKYLFKIEIFVILVLIVLSSCGNSNVAQTFDSKQIDNGYNNYIVGGNMAYIENNLLINFSSDNNNIAFGTYRFNNNGCEQVLINESTLGTESVFAPEFYQIDGDIYVLGNEMFGKYDIDNDKLSESDYNYYYENFVYARTAYFSDDLVVYDSDNVIHIKYKENSEYTIDKEFWKYYVYDNTVYLMNYDGWLYKYDITSGNSECEFLSRLNEDTSEVFEVCGDYVYFNSSKAGESKSDLYRYSLSKDEIDFISDGEINCLNSYDGVMYFSKDNGIYRDNIGEVEKITNRSAKEIYLLDEDYIYAVQNDAGNAYRVPIDGGTVEIIDFLNSNI